MGKAQDKHKKGEASQRGKAHWAEVVKIIKKSRAGNQIALVRERENIQGERQYTGIGIYRGRLSGVGSFTRALKNSTNTASNYTTINKPAAQVQMRHLTECAQQIQQLPGESVFEGPRGCSRDACPQHRQN